LRFTGAQAFDFSLHIYYRQWSYLLELSETTHHSFINSQSQVYFFYTSCEGSIVAEEFNWQNIPAAKIPS
jgi:hypothetical protein